MKVSSLLVLVPLLAAQAHAFAIPDGLSARAGNNKGKPAIPAKATTSAKATTTAKAAATSAAAKGGAGGKIVAAASASSSAAASAAAPAASSDPGFCGTDPQKSLCLDASQVQTGLEQDGQETPEAGQVPSLVSFNNFINFCETFPDLPLTNGLQIKTGSCNPTPMGVIISQDKMPSCKFQNPKNNDVIPANTAFTISLAINNLHTGNFVNAAANYFAAPAQTDDQGILLGHSHVVIEAIDSLTSTTVTDPTRFAFFKGLNDAAVNGILTADVTGGLPAGVYKMSTINSASNHQPVLVSIAQHAALDDTVYFTVTDGAAAGGSTAGDASASASADATSSTAAAAASGAASKGQAAAASGKGKGSASTSVESTSTSAAASTATAKSGSKGQGGAAKGSSNTKTTSTAKAAATSAKSTSSAAAAASTKSSTASKGNDTAAKPPSSCD